MIRNTVKTNLKFLLILTIMITVVGCGKADSDAADNYGNVQSIETVKDSGPHSESVDTAVSMNLEITEDISFTLTTPNSTEDEPVKLSGNFIEDLRNVYERCVLNANSVEELENKIKEIDSENRINSICVYEHGGDYINDIPITDKKLNLYEAFEGQILYVKYDNDKAYITGRPDRVGYNSEEYMICSIIAKADTIEELVMDFDGWDYDGSGSGKKMTSISVYSSYNDAWGPQGGDNPTSVIMENGQWVVTEGSWNPDGRIRVTYDDGVSWFALRYKGEIL